MKKLSNSIIALVGVIALVGLFSLVTPTSGRGQESNAPPARDVNVINTPSVNIANPASSPGLVRNVDVPLRTPVQIQVNVFVQFGETNAFANVYTVPDGQRLVIEHVALLSDTLDAGNAIRGSVLTVHGQDCAHHFDVRAQTPVNGPLFVVNHSLLAFANPGSSVRMDLTLDHAIGSSDTSGGFSGFRGTLSGYLENVQ